MSINLHTPYPRLTPCILATRHTTVITPRRFHAGCPRTYVRGHASYLAWNDAREGELTFGRHCMAPCVGARPHNRPQSSQPHPLARLGDSTPVAHNRTCEACPRTSNPSCNRHGMTSEGGLTFGRHCMAPCHHTIFFTTIASSSRKIASSWESWHSLMAA